MDNPNLKVAVITGAASGLGQALAVDCAQRGYSLVLADIEVKNLAATTALLGTTDAITLSVNVANAADVEALAVAAYERFGQVDLLFNNAGVAVSGPVWTAPDEEWDWVMNVNMKGVVYGLRAFVPRMLQAGRPGHIVNTSSAAGFLPTASSGIYAASKHAVIAISESLHHELQLIPEQQIKVSVLCPAFFKTRISESARLRPESVGRNPHPMTKITDQIAKDVVANATMTAAEVAQITMTGIANGDFYILTHEDAKQAMRERFNRILEGGQPYNPMPG